MARGIFFDEPEEEETGEPETVSLEPLSAKWVRRARQEVLTQRDPWPRSERWRVHTVSVGASTFVGLGVLLVP